MSASSTSCCERSSQHLPHISTKLFQLAVGLAFQRAGALKRPDLEAFSGVEGKVAAKIINVDRLVVRSAGWEALTFFADHWGYCAQKYARGLTLRTSVLS